MTLLEIVLLLVIAAICGALGQAIAGYSPGGFFAKVGVGFIGAVLGTWMARALDLPVLFTVRLGGHTFPIIWSIAGSALFVAVISLLARPRLRESW
jgi:uncharacterized membrane protein YeaQ/YmgE (transglycosylase-associated protein family)